jgi:hypothetical protein
VSVSVQAPQVPDMVSQKGVEPLHSLSLVQPVQVLVARLQMAVVPAHASWLLAVHCTHRYVVVLQAPVGPPQSASLVQPVQVLVLTLQVGVLPVQATPLVAEHCTHAPVALLQAGVAPPQSLSLLQPVQVLVLASHAGVSPWHWVFLAGEHCTQAPLVVLHTGTAPPHWGSLVHGKPQKPLASEHTGATAGQACEAPEPLLPLQLVHEPLAGPDITTPPRWPLGKRRRRRCRSRQCTA